MSMLLRIGQLADRVGVTAKTVRYYEALGLIPSPPRSEAGYRLYSADDEGRMRFIAAARRVGFTLGEIKEILALRDRGRAPCGYVAGTVERRIREIERQLAQLRALKLELMQLRERAQELPAPVVEDGVYCHMLGR